jgi:acetyltransferase-like isoleucine patch superfamily enzyme
MIRFRYKLYKLKRKVYNISNFYLWLKACYYTFKYVDHYNVFPCFVLNNKIKLNIYKKKNSKITINNIVIFNSWLKQKGETNITLCEGSSLEINNELILGQNINVFLNYDAKLIFEGKKNESGCGITASSTIMVNQFVKIGNDSIIAFDTFITDCDWHHVQNSKHTFPTIINEKVWIGAGVKILKGVEIGKNSIVTANSVVTKGIYPEFSFLSGNPAKLLDKKAPIWNRDMHHYE